MPAPAYGLTQEPAALRFEGRLTFAEAGALWSQLSQNVAAVEKGQRIDFDMTKVERVDGGSMALLVHLRADLHRRGASSEFIGAGDEVQKIIHLYRGDVRVGALRKRRAQSMIEQIAASTMAIVTKLKQAFGFFGQAMVALVGLIVRPGSANWKDVPPTMEKTGADAVPIVILFNFLVGFVMAFQGSVQLKQFGANIYVADLVGLSICRELGPLMTAIVLCGRSGAAFAGGR